LLKHICGGNVDPALTASLIENERRYMRILIPRYQGCNRVDGPAFLRLENPCIDKELVLGGDRYDSRSGIWKYVLLTAFNAPSAC
jgi:hypothetical protein